MGPLLLRVCLGDVALVFSLELADDLELGKPPRTTLPVMLEGELRKHDSRPISRQSRGRMVRSQDPGAYLTGQSSHFSFVNITQRVQVFVQKRVEDVRIEGLAILCDVGYLVEEASVHHYEIRAHLVESANVVWKISETKHQTGPSLSETSLHRFLDQLKDFREIEAPVQSLRYTNIVRG
jgi:hypothetical protein